MMYFQAICVAKNLNGNQTSFILQIIDLDWYNEKSCGRYFDWQKYLRSTKVKVIYPCWGWWTWQTGLCPGWKSYPGVALSQIVACTRTSPGIEPGTLVSNHSYFTTQPPWRLKVWPGSQADRLQSRNLPLCASYTITFKFSLNTLVTEGKIFYILIKSSDWIYFR